MLKGLIRLHVSHFVALEFLTSVSWRLGAEKAPPVRISVLGIRPPSKVPTMPWKPVIHDAIRADPLSTLDAATIVALINDLLLKSKALADSATLDIVKFFRSEKLRHLPGTIHCEAALASLAKYSDHLPSTEHGSLQGLLKVRFAYNHECISDQ
jgi:hypothetical protein